MLGVVEQVAHIRQDGARPLCDLLALLGELDARLAALDQAYLELVLELLDLHAERGLADRAGLRRVSKMAGFLKRFQVAQLAERDHPTRPSDKCRLCIP